VLIAIGNSNDASLATDAERLLADASAIVRGAAVWALSQLMEPEAFARLASQAAIAELETTVQAEWATARPSP
jgi:epoxyqueuosine reductase